MFSEVETDSIIKDLQEENTLLRLERAEHQKNINQLISALEKQKLDQDEMVCKNSIESVHKEEKIKMLEKNLQTLNNVKSEELRKVQARYENLMTRYTELQQKLMSERDVHKLSTLHLKGKILELEGEIIRERTSDSKERASGLDNGSNSCSTETTSHECTVTSDTMTCGTQTCSITSEEGGESGQSDINVAIGERNYWRRKALSLQREIDKCSPTLRTDKLQRMLAHVVAENGQLRGRIENLLCELESYVSDVSSRGVVGRRLFDGSLISGHSSRRADQKNDSHEKSASLCTTYFASFFHMFSFTSSKNCVGSHGSFAEVPLLNEE